MNEETIEVAEVKKKATGPQKNLRFTSDVEKDELLTILSSLEEQGIAQGGTDGDRILSALKSVLDEGQRAEVLANANQTLAKVFESTFIELDLMQRNVVNKYQSLMTVANLEVDKVRSELTEHFEKKVEKLEKSNDRLENELNSVKEDNNNLQSLIEVREHSVNEAYTRVDDLTKALSNKDLSIESLQNQLTAKNDLVEEYKSRIDESNATIAQMTTTQQANLEEMKELRAENKVLNERYLKNSEDITKLTNELEKANIELNHAKQNVTRYETEINKVNEQHATELAKLESRYQAELDQLRKELSAERESKSNLQSELLKLMSAMTVQQQQTEGKSKQKSKEN